MKNNTTRKTINVDKPNLIPLWTLKQEDDVILKLALFKEATPFNIVGQTIKLGAKTLKGLKEQIDGFTIKENELDIALKNSILVPGLIEIDLEFKDAGGKMTSTSFFINVNSKVLNDVAVKATNEFDTFTKTVTEIEKDYQGLRKIVIDENNAANLQDQVNKVNSSLEQNQKLANDTKVQKYLNKAIITFIDDDAQSLVYTKQKPLYDSLGIKGCVAVPTKLIGNVGHCTDVQLSQLVLENWELLSHTHNHVNLATLENEAEIRLECEESYKILKNLGSKGYNIMVYPNGGHNALVRKIVKEKMLLGITVDSGLNYTPLQSYSLKRVNSVKDNGTLINYDELKNSLDEAIAKKGWLIVMTHIWQDAWNNESEVEKFKDFVKYAKTQDVDFKTVTEALEVVQNVIDVGDNDFTVGRDGRIGGNKLDIKAFEQSYDTTVSSSTPVSYFKKGICTITYYSSSEASGKGFPPKGYNEGTLITYRPNGNSGVNPDYGAYQTYKAVQVEELYIRHWIVGSSSWSAWKPVGGSNMVNQLTKDNVTNDTLINQFPTNNITVCQITYSNATLSSFPNGDIGELITYRIADNDAYSYQIYKPATSNKTYIRTWSNSTNWGKWGEQATINKNKVTIDFGTVNANSGKQVNVTLTGVKSTDQFLIRPNGGLEECMLFAYSDSNDLVKVRIFNYTSSAITVNREFIITSIT